MKLTRLVPQQQSPLTGRHKPGGVPVQQKAAHTWPQPAAAAQRHAPAAPPVYRPQPPPRVLQTKASVPLPHAAGARQTPSPQSSPQSKMPQPVRPVLSKDAKPPAHAHAARPYRPEVLREKKAAPRAAFARPSAAPASRPGPVLQAKGSPRPPQAAQSRSGGGPARGPRPPAFPTTRVVQRMKIKEIKTDLKKAFKYSSRMGTPYVMIDAGSSWHLSFHPDGVGGKEYKEAVVAAAIQYADGGGNDNGWEQPWMTDELPFAVFHVTAPSGNHFFFDEKGAARGEQKKGTDITEAERTYAWRLSGVVTHGLIHPAVSLSSQPNWAMSPNSPMYRTSPPGLSAPAMSGMAKPKTDEAWPKAQLKGGELKFS